MKITMILPSNRPIKFKRFVKSIPILGAMRPFITIHVSAQPPWNEVALDSYLLSGAIDTYSMHTKSTPTRMIEWRRKGMEMHQDSDYFIFLDDDHHFYDPDETKRYQMSCAEYYRTSFNFLEENKDVGVLCLRGSLGGSDWGYDIKKTPKNAILSTDKGGLIIRNIGIDKICPEWLLGNRGALFESVFGYNVMSHGYKNAKRFNCPTRAEPPGSAKRIGASTNTTYSDAVVDENNNKYIREKFNDLAWCHSSKKYPADITKMIKTNGWDYND